MTFRECWNMLEHMPWKKNKKTLAQWTEPSPANNIDLAPHILNIECHDFFILWHHDISWRFMMIHEYSWSEGLILQVWELWVVSCNQQLSGRVFLPIAAAIFFGSAREPHSLPGVGVGPAFWATLHHTDLGFDGTPWSTDENVLKLRLQPLEKTCWPLLAQIQDSVP